MISQNRVRALARENKVTVGMMEKDHVNSWILYAIYNSPLKEELAFKGGTALSKIYFPKIWRFSEDLDLTAYREINREGLVKVLRSALSNASEKSGVHFEIKSTHFTPGYVQIKVQYEASLGQKNTTRLDITLDETLSFGLEEKLHSFEDIPEFTVVVYSLDEIIVEKIRSLFERERARDFFDVYKILEMNAIEDFGGIVKNLKEKMEHKEMNLKLDFPERKVEDVASHWDMALDRLISTAEKPEFSKAMQEIESFLDRIKNLDEDFR